MGPDRQWFFWFSPMFNLNGVYLTIEPGLHLSIQRLVVRLIPTPGETTTNLFSINPIEVKE